MSAAGVATPPRSLNADRGAVPVATDPVPGRVRDAARPLPGRLAPALRRRARRPDPRHARRRSPTGWRVRADLMPRPRGNGCAAAAARVPAHPQRRLAGAVGVGAVRARRRDRRQDHRALAQALPAHGTREHRRLRRLTAVAIASAVLVAAGIALLCRRRRGCARRRLARGRAARADGRGLTVAAVPARSRSCIWAHGLTVAQRNGHDAPTAQRSCAGPCSPRPACWLGPRSRRGSRASCAAGRAVLRAQAVIAPVVAPQWRR